MAPNVAGEDNTQVLELKVNDKQRQEIFYDGYFYDVTDFVARHPGGNVIQFYTASGEDATQAIQQFHFRQRKRVDVILRTFKRRKAEPKERGLEPRALTRHEALSADFLKLFEELQAEGYFEPCIRHVVLRLVEFAAITIFAFGIFFNCDRFSTRFFSAIFCGFALSRYGWLLHEGGHSSLSGRPKIDKFIQDLAGCVLLGYSPKWWNSQHNRHHAMPQRLNHDVDLSTLPFVAFNKRTVKDKSEIYNFFVRYQAIFYWTLDLFVVVIAWRFIIHPRYQLHKKAYFEMLMGLPSLLFAFYTGPLWYITFGYWFAFFLAINFALSHSHLDVADKPTHWIEYSLTHTANIRGSMFVDYWMGYLNYQIEHHLFPSMPQFRQGQICHRVKALAEKHGLPYMVYGYAEACALAMKNLDTVGKELTREDNFGTK